MTLLKTEQTPKSYKPNALFYSVLWELKTQQDVLPRLEHFVTSALHLTYMWQHSIELQD